MSTVLSKPCIEVNTQVALPDNSGYTWIWDSTEPRRFDGVQKAKTAAVRTVGPDRGGAKNLRAMIGVSCATQNATLVLYTLDGAGAWRLYSSTTITAGNTPQFVEWRILAPDALIGILAGASAPSAIAHTLLLTEQS